MIRSTLPTPVRRGPLLAAAGALVLLAGCGGTGGAKTVTAASGTPTPTGTAVPAGSTTGPDQRTPHAAPTVVARRKGTIDDEPVLLEIIGLRRSRATVALSLRLTTTSDHYTGIGKTFDDGIIEKSRDPEATAPLQPDTLDGIYLVDGEHGRRYLVGRDRENNCVCDIDLINESLEKDVPMNLSAIFGAPPPSVKVVDVFIPRFGTFKDLPLG